ncbi:MAG: hypothetical protein QOF78_731 [Phycisphaerales bacterium]|jgi:hypothetical protein|nr:hypothetical protein [Phycisphaerales bacterium]
MAKQKSEGPYRRDALGGVRPIVAGMDEIDLAAEREGEAQSRLKGYRVHRPVGARHTRRRAESLSEGEGDGERSD